MKNSEEKTQNYSILNQQNKNAYNELILKQYGRVNLHIIGLLVTKRPTQWECYTCMVQLKTKLYTMIVDYNNTEYFFKEQVL